MSTSEATAITRANIALAKYWGKSDVPLNLPAVPSISLTLDPMCTQTTVSFLSDLEQDEVSLDDQPASGRPLQRVVKVLDQVRALAGISRRARVRSGNNFPTASGLASSASGFAALVAASSAAAGLPRDDDRLSAMSRQASASAARSIYGGFVELPAGTPGDADLCARRLAPPEHWDVCIVVAVLAEGPKDVGSTEGMTLCEQTSPYYRPWIEASDALTDQVREGVLQRDLSKLGEAMEQSTLAMHACMMASRPGLLYWQPATLAALGAVKALRKQGIEVYSTMDAGPHVKALCHARDAERVASALADTPLVLRTLTARPGPDLELRQ